MTTPSVIVPAQRLERDQRTKNNREEATGTRGTCPLANIPSIISIDSMSLIVIALCRGQRNLSVTAQDTPTEGE